MRRCKTLLDIKFSISIDIKGFYEIFFKSKTGGERGIRTLDTLLTYTDVPGLRIQPLCHLSKC